jgi:hypothetical protein
MTPTDNVRVLAQRDPLVSSAPPPHHLPPLKLQKPSTSVSQYPTSADIPMQEIRRQNDVDRWRNKLRLQEKFEVRSRTSISEQKKIRHYLVSSNGMPTH